MHEWMRKDKEAHETEGKPEERELQNCDRRVGFAEA